MTGKWKREKDNIMQRLHRNRPVEMQWFPDVYTELHSIAATTRFHRHWQHLEAKTGGEGCVYRNRAPERGSSGRITLSPEAGGRSVDGELCTTLRPPPPQIRLRGEKKDLISSLQRTTSYEQITWRAHRTFSHLRQVSRANNFYGLVQF